MLWAPFWKKIATTESNASASLGPPRGFDTKGKYLPTEDTSSSFAHDICDPYLQTTIHGEALSSKVIKSPQEDLHSFKGGSARLWAAHFAPKR